MQAELRLWSIRGLYVEAGCAWFAERDALRATTPGTPEYRAAVEAAGQLTLDALAEAKP